MLEKFDFFKNLNLKNIIVFSILFVYFFVFFNLIAPVGYIGHNLNETDFSVSTRNVNQKNKWSTFRRNEDSSFFIHPGDKLPTVAEFKFKKNANIIIDFFLSKKMDGEVLFTLNKNKNKVKEFVINSDNQEKISLNIERGDFIEIYADKLKSSSEDHANFHIVSSNNLYDKIFAQVIPLTWFILFFFLYKKNYHYLIIITYCLLLLTLTADKITLHFMSFENALKYSVTFLSIPFLLIFFHKILFIVKHKKLRIIITTLFYSTFFCLSLIGISTFLIYYLNFGVSISKDTLFAIFQSNFKESVEYIVGFIKWRFITGLVLFLLLIIFFSYKQSAIKINQIDKYFFSFVSLCLISISCVFIQDLRLTSFVKTSFADYINEINLFKEIQKKRNAGEIEFKARKSSNGETYIVIIGESLNKNHMGLYGYLRNTTPHLSEIAKQNNTLVFKNAYSSHVNTMPSLKLSLTEANQYNSKNYYNSLSIIDICKNANFKTYWLTNQVLYGAWDNMVSVVAHSTDNLVSINKSIGTTAYTEKQDGELIQEVKNLLAEKTDSNRVIFVHLMGSHGTYFSRYPKESFSQFEDNLEPGDYGNETYKNRANINDYDNSIFYNDYVVSSIIKELKKENGVNGFLYFADHADDVVNNLGHDSNKFTYEMTEIPMLTWFSDSYIKKYNYRYLTLDNNKNKIYSNDMIYNTLIGIMSIETDKYNSKYDISSIDYSINSDNALILGELPYSNSSNHIYWKKSNSKYLINTNQSSRIFPHRVNSLGKLKEIWHAGFRSFEVDVIFNSERNYFQVGHDSEHTSNYTLEEFLSRIDYNEIQRIWLDFKNLDQNNYKKAINRLNYLDSNFNIITKTLVESGTTNFFFRELKKNNWYTSYYLPTQKIVELQNNNARIELNKLATEIAKQIKTQNVSAVSFDSRLYSFVKNHLERKISSKVEYHIWYAPNLRNANFKDQLSKSEVYKDERVKTLLTVFPSKFNL